ncbi:unnamed protein product, partial [Didymodactylos carnosus]
MITAHNLKRIREILDSHGNNEFDIDSPEDDESDSDTDYHVSGIESNDTSADEHISQEEDSSDCYVSDDDKLDETQPESIEKNGVTWSTKRTTVAGRLAAVNIFKRKPGPVTSTQTILEAFKLFFTNDLLNEVVLQTNKYAGVQVDQQNRRSNTGADRRKSAKWSELDRVELEAFIGLLIDAGAEMS